MKKLAIIGGISLVSFATTNMILHKQKINLNPNTLAIASGGFFIALGITYRF
tara:strand:+ start:228 stop:383 length:156 start_codon:yes stop_codon:yes gene_type:complete